MSNHPHPDIKAIMHDVAHRPWPMPSGPWIMFQSWRELLFAHWPVPTARLRPHVPSSLLIEEFDGTAWVGLTPFLLVGLRPRGLPALPGLSAFPELNLRTYIRVGVKPGVYFFSLDAASRLAVLGARIWYHLPYYFASMELEVRDGWRHYRSSRRTGTAEFMGRYRPTGEPFRPAAGTLEHFLTERYILYAVLSDGRIARGDIHHRPWQLQSAEAEIARNSIATASGIELPGEPPLLHFAAQQDVLVWRPTLLA